jgi:mono/diheme cytochrome c family protein
MSMKRSIELSVIPSVSLISRVVLIGSVLSFAAACGRRDAAKTDSSVATADSATTSTATATTSSSPVESVSTGETTISAESKANPAVAGTNVATGVANTAATPASPTHHTVHHTDSAKTAPKPAAATATPAKTASDTGQKAAPADTGKKTAAAGGTADHLLVSPQEYEGWKMFSVYCYRCHGVDAMGGGIAPNLRHSVSSEGSVTHDIFIQTVTDGRLDKGMPTWKALLSPEQMEDLWLYVNARSSGRLAPGRPHMDKGANP